jgi:hypothetical protein
MGILALAAFLTVASSIGCSNMKQSAEFTKDGVGVKLVNSKSTFMYWSKYKASVHNYGMSAIVYDAEGRPDPNSVKAFAEGVTETIMKGFKP